MGMSKGMRWSSSRVSKRLKRLLRVLFYFIEMNNSEILGQLVKVDYAFKKPSRKQKK